MEGVRCRGGLALESWNLNEKVAVDVSLRICEGIGEGRRMRLPWPWGSCSEDGEGLKLALSVFEAAETRRESLHLRGISKNAKGKLQSFTIF